MPMNARDARIDTLRGIACLLLVAYHVIGGGEGRGLDPAPDSFLSWFSDSMAYLRMPLFTFLAGFVFAQRENLASESGRFLWGKIRRLLLPLVCVGTLYFFVQGVVGEEDLAASYFEVFLFPFEHFWYLQSLFLIFVAVFFMDVGGWIRTPQRLLAATAIAFLLAPLIEFETNLFSINGAIYLLPYFLMGIAFKRLPWLTDIHQGSRHARGFIVVSTLMLTVLHQASVLGTFPELFHPYKLSGEIYSVACIAFLYSIGLSSGALSWIGGYSYSIYLFHVFGTAGARIVLGKMGVVNEALLFSSGMLAGLILPVVVEKVFDRSPVLRMAFLGRSYSVRKPAFGS
jgi:glucans biosynthesis protein C